jgi:hypothetical protein
MSNRAMKIAVALSIVLTPPAASFARGGGGHGGGHAGFAAMGAFSRPAGSAGTGNVPISGIPRGPGNAGGINNATVDPSGIGNAARMATLPQPHIAAPTQPGGSRNPVAPLSMNLNQQALPEALGGGGRQPRADQVPSEQSLMDPNGPYNRELNRENAVVDRMLDICRGC